MFETRVSFCFLYKEISSIPWENQLCCKNGFFVAFLIFISTIWVIFQLLTIDLSLRKGFDFPSEARWVLGQRTGPISYTRAIIPDVLKAKNISLPQTLPFADPSVYIGGMWSFDQELFICNIGKNSNTKLKYLFAELVLSRNLSEFSQSRWIHDNLKGAVWMSYYLPSELYEYFLKTFSKPSSDWTFLVFIRDPVQRFLSGFKDKCTKDFPRVEAYEDRCFNMTMRNYIDYLYRMLNNGTICDVDPHFRPQWCFCDMVWTQAPYVIYKFDSSSRDQIFQDFLHDYNLERHAHLFRTSTFHSTDSFQLKLNFSKIDKLKFRKVFSVDYELFELVENFPT